MTHEEVLAERADQGRTQLLAGMEARLSEARSRGDEEKVRWVEAQIRTYGDYWVLTDALIWALKDALTKSDAFTASIETHVSRIEATSLAMRTRLQILTTTNRLLALGRRVSSSRRKVEAVAARRVEEAVAAEFEADRLSEVARRTWEEAQGQIESVKDQIRSFERANEEFLDGLTLDESLAMLRQEET